MLDNLATVPWSTLRQCYGTAEDVPGLITDLASADASKRKEALANLWTLLWHQGSVYEASAAAVPFLCELLRAPGVRGKPAIVAMVHAIASDPEAQSNIDPIWAPEVDYSFLADALRVARHTTQTCRAAVAAELDTFLGLLSDPSRRLRAGAALILECCPAHFARIRLHLRRRINQERNGAIKAVLIQVWRCTCKGSASKKLNRALRNLALASDEKPVVRLVAALGLASRLPSGATPKFTRFLTNRLRRCGQSLERLNRYHVHVGLNETLANQTDLKFTVLLALAERPTPYWRKHLLYEFENVCRERRSQFPEVAAVLGRLLSHDDAEFRAKVAMELSHVGTWARFAREPLLRALNDSNADVAIWAALALGKLGDAGALPFLLAALAPAHHADLPDCQPWEISPASKRLRRFRFLVDALRPHGAAAAAALPTLRTLLTTGPAHVQSIVAPAFAWIGEPAKDAVPLVAALLKDPATQDAAASALAQWGDLASSALGDLSEFLRGFPDAGVWARIPAIEAIGNLGTPAAEALPTLRHYLRDSDCTAKCKAAEAIWQIAPGDPEVLGVLLDQLSDKTKQGWGIHGCGQVLQALMAIGAPAVAAAPILKQLLGDPSGWNRIDAARLLWKIGVSPETIIPTLIRDLLCQPLGIEAGRIAAECLAEIGPAAHVALPRIKEILSRDDTFAGLSSIWVESDEAYRNALTHAMMRIQGESS